MRGRMAVPFNSIYHATKWALEGWSEIAGTPLEQSIEVVLMNNPALFSLNKLYTRRSLRHSPNAEAILVTH